MGCEDPFRPESVEYFSKQKYGAHSQEIVLAFEFFGRFSPAKVSCRNEGTINLALTFVDVCKGLSYPFFTRPRIFSIAAVSDSVSPGISSALC